MNFVRFFCRAAPLAVGLVVASGVADVAMGAVGRTPGEVLVTANGAGVYRIPLSLPPGTNGLAPELALVYDHTAGNGLMGVGWDVTGLSAITRCPKTVAQDTAISALNLTTADRFCFNGNRLRVTSGTYGAANSTYQTEVESYSRFTALGSSGTNQGPLNFKVEQKDGLILEFGNTADSRIEATGSTAVREWALNRISDRSSNYIDFIYTEDTTNGSYRPSEIRWTGNVNQGTGWLFRAKFVYGGSDRPDPLVRYHIGQKIKEVKRLDRIEIEHYPSTLVRQYRFTYETATYTGRSRLKDIEECDGAGTPSCLAKTLIDWRSNSSGWAGTENTTSTTASTFESALVMDITGDGRDDYVWYNASGGTGWQVQPGNSSGGFDAAISTGLGGGTYYNRALPPTSTAMASAISWFRMVRLPTGTGSATRAAPLSRSTTRERRRRDRRAMPGRSMPMATAATISPGRSATPAAPSCGCVSTRRAAGPRPSRPLPLLPGAPPGPRSDSPIPSPSVPRAGSFAVRAGSSMSTRTAGWTCWSRSSTTSRTARARCGSTTGRR